MPVEERRNRTGYDVICVPYDTLLASEQFGLLCQAASIDADMPVVLCGPAFVAENDIRRIATYSRNVERCASLSRQ